MASALAGCSTYGDFCQRKMDCLNGNDADYDACIIDYDTNENLSDLYGCDVKWSDYLDCVDSNYHCSGKNWTDNGDCGNEWSNFRDCID